MPAPPGRARGAGSKDYPYRFDDGKASFACRFLEQLPHVKGEWGAAEAGTQHAAEAGAMADIQNLLHYGLG